MVQNGSAQDLPSMPTDLTAALKGVQAVMDAFNLYGMKIRPPKSVILLEIHGTEAKKAIKRALQQNKPGSREMLYQQLGETIHVPIKESHGYLATIISYRHSDTLMLKHRMSKARG